MYMAWTATRGMHFSTNDNSSSNNNNDNDFRGGCGFSSGSTSGVSGVGKHDGHRRCFFVESD